MLQRRACVSYLLEGRPKTLLAVAGLGSSAWDLSAAGNVPENFCFIGAMGQAAPFALGLALAQPSKRIVLFTGDGEILMSLGILATIANLAPTNLVVTVLDNEVYGETGGQATATAGQTDLVAIARGAGIQSTASVTKESDLAVLREIIHSGNVLHFANLKIVSEKLPLAFPYSFDGVTSVNRFRDAATSS
ncbi:MAG: thiamine pyrophosphate-dependent enzyme [Proteobacteria bacterium]|nr:thiamine pyrophosphate-dependent enzyme [Pseudomonadota bacterium]